MFFWFFAMYYLHIIFTCMRDNIIETRILTYVCIWPQVFAAPFFCGLVTVCYSRRAISSGIAVREWRYWRTRNLYHKCNTWQSSFVINPKMKRFIFFFFSSHLLLNVLSEDCYLHVIFYWDCSSKFCFIAYNTIILRKIRIFYFANNRQNRLHRVLHRNKLF